MGKEERVSFSFSSKSSSSSRPKRPRPLEPQETQTLAADSTDSKPQYVTVFDPSETLAAAPPKIVIPPIPNSSDFRLGSIKKMKNLSLPSDGEQKPESESNKFVIADPDSTAPADNISFGLTIRAPSTAASADNVADNGNGNSGPKPSQEDLNLKRFHEDMKNLPDDRGMEEFKEVPIESFAAAVLAGYGWTEGKGIGRNNKGDTKVVQYDRRVGTQGLGYTPSANNDIVAVENSTKVVRIISGPHSGKKGKVLSRLEGAELVLRLIDGGEEVMVVEDWIAELGSRAEERCLTKLKELETGDRSEKREKRRDIGDKKCRSSDHRREDGQSRDSRERNPVGWLRSHIRVRIISKDFKGGKWYLKKGEVVDVIGPRMCDISIDGSNELVQGVDQEILETALPKRGGSVLVLYGRHKGVYGSLVERDMEEETGVVRDADSHDLINVRLEQIAEYVGDPSYLGY